VKNHGTQTIVKVDKKSPPTWIFFSTMRSLQKWVDIKHKLLLNPAVLHSFYFLRFV